MDRRPAASEAGAGAARRPVVGPAAQAIMVHVEFLLVDARYAGHRQTSAGLPSAPECKRCKTRCHMLIAQVSPEGRGSMTRRARSGSGASKKRKRRRLAARRNKVPMPSSEVPASSAARGVDAERVPASPPQSSGRSTPASTSAAAPSRGARAGRLRLVWAARCRPGAGSAPEVVLRHVSAQGLGARSCGPFGPVGGDRRGPPGGHSSGEPRRQRRGRLTWLCSSNSCVVRTPASLAATSTTSRWLSSAR